MESERLEDGFVNIDQMEEFHDLDMRHALAAVIAADTIDEVNRRSEAVHPRQSFYSRFGKRALDLLFSTIALVLTAPVNAILAVCTFFDVGRPILFKQTRPGKDGTEFEIVKFRNMTNATDENGNLLPASQRVTKFGKFVRKTSLDELLNFWSVFKGDMSLIGPRPLAIRYTDRFSERHSKRDLVRPGLECPCLKKLDHKMTWTDQFENDIYYVENLSLWLDLKMVFALVGMVVNKKSSAMRGSAVRGSFMGYNRDGSSINSRAVPRQYVERVLKESQKETVASI